MTPSSRVKLGEVASVKGGKRLPKGHDFSSDRTNHPYIRARDIRGGKITFDDPVYISDETHEKIKRYIVNAGDVCITIVGANVGDVGQVPAFLDKANLTENAVKIVGNSPDYAADYVKYALLADDAQKQMKNFAAGAAQPKLGIYKINEIEIPYPDLDLRKQIGEILSAYDNLIENNNRRIAILEEMAQSLYREWFVKFRFPGHDQSAGEPIETAESDPEGASAMEGTSQNAKFIDSPLGNIPKGWEVKTLKEVLELAYGKALKKDARRGGDVAVYGSGGIGGYHDEALVEGPCIIVGRKGNVGSVFWCDSDCWPIDTVFYVKSDISQYFIYYNLLGQVFHNSDAAVPGLNRESAYSNKLVVPTNDILSEFDRYVGVLFQQMSNLKGKVTNLTAQRDLLLPKLIAGKIHI